jgi:DNA-directed RNA polymerase subunit L
MSDIDIQVTDNSKQFADALERRVPIILEACGLVGEEHAKNDARVDTGRYRSSITHTVSGQGGQVHEYRDNNGKQFTETLQAVPESERAVYIGTNVEYALYLEQKDHTIKNAIANHVKEYKKIIQDGMKVE